MNESFKERVEKAAQAIHSAEKLVIGAGAGLSAAAGLNTMGKDSAITFSPLFKNTV